jgi:AcrR family transcriptional regulator
MRKRFARAESDAEARFDRPPPVQSERQCQILAVAAELFRERGYHATTMAEIGAAAGISGPAIYRHFSSKDELLHVALWTLARRNAREVRHARERAASDPASQLLALVRAFVRVVIEERDIACVYLFETRHAPENLVAQFYEIERAWHEEWIEALCAVRASLDETTAQTLIRAATFLVGSVTIEQPALDVDVLERILFDATMAMLLGSEEGSE